LLVRQFGTYFGKLSGQSNIQQGQSVRVSFVEIWLDSDWSVVTGNSVMQVHKIPFLHWGAYLDRNPLRYPQQYSSQCTVLQ